MRRAGTHLPGDLQEGRRRRRFR